MSSPGWDRLEELLATASGLAPADRTAFAERVAADEPELGAALHDLIDATEGSEAFIEHLRDELLGAPVAQVIGAAHDGPDPWIGATISHYELVERIASGGMGVVYRAVDRVLDRSVALKFIAPEIRRDDGAREQFLREARAASALDHPNICTVHEITTADGTLCIVMPAYEGETLRARIARGRLPIPEAIDVARQVARGLAAAHARGIVHRDVKPENVFITHDAMAKLLDFGLARPIDATADDTERGTVAYMSPEQLRGEPATARSDVWAAGVLLHEMVTGVHPFAGEDVRAPTDRVGRVELGQTGQLRRAPAAAVAVITRALAQDPLARYADGAALCAALEALDVGAFTAHASQPRRARPGRPARMVVALSFGALAAVPAIMARDNDPPAGAPLVSHVLWVDDNPENNAGIVERLQRGGVRVTTALSTADGARQYDPGIHGLVISDMGRYEGGGGAYVGRAGFDLLDLVRARRQDARVVFCTSARAADLHRAEAVAAGAVMLDDCGRILELVGL